MFVDASAIVAILALEPDAAELTEKLERTDQAYTSPLAMYEASVGIARIFDIAPRVASSRVGTFLQQARVEILPISPAVGIAAISAFERYGKGRHPARLNMADCFAYAGAQAIERPLLFKGNDFSKTDITAA